MSTVCRIAALSRLRARRRCDIFCRAAGAKSRFEFALEDFQLDQKAQRLEIAGIGGSSGLPDFTGCVMLPLDVKRNRRDCVLRTSCRRMMISNRYSLLRFAPYSLRHLGKLFIFNCFSSFDTRLDQGLRLIAE